MSDNATGCGSSATAYSTSAQIAQSGTFFAHPGLGLTCESPVLGSLCEDFGIAPGEDVFIYVGKRNVEGGPRISTIKATNWRALTGIEGDINANWAYDASFMFARNNSQESNENDFLTANLAQGLLNCNDPDLVDTPSCYNAWEPGGVTPAAAAALGGTGIRTGDSSMMVGNTFVTGDLGLACRRRAAIPSNWWSAANGGARNTSARVTPTWPWAPFSVRVVRVRRWKAVSR